MGWSHGRCQTRRNTEVREEAQCRRLEQQMSVIEIVALSCRRIDLQVTQVSCGAALTTMVAESKTTVRAEIDLVRKSMVVVGG
jgi:hypothetical protein